MAQGNPIRMARGKDTGFSPDGITGLQFWLDAADASTIHEDTTAGRVSQWDDKSGNDEHVTNDTTSREPATGGTTWNGNNVIEFGLAEELFYNTAAPAIGSALFDNSTVFIVLEELVHSNYSRFFSAVATGNDYQVGFYGGFSTTNNLWSIGCPSGPLEAGTGLLGPSILVAKPEAGTAYVNDGWRDGATFNSTNTGTWASRTAPTIWGIACRTSNGGRTTSNGANVRIAEILVYDTVLGTDDTNDVGNYLADKWGLTWSDIT